jgi:hypothetical protein
MFDVFKVTSAALSATAKLLVLQLRGRGDEGDDEGAEPADDAPFIQQLGFAARPVISRTLRALGYPDGDDVHVLKVWDKTKVPASLSPGETVVFSAGDVSVRISLLQDGNITIEAGAAASQKVAHGGSSTVSHMHLAGTLIAGPYAVSGATAGTAAAIDPATCADKVKVTP